MPEMTLREFYAGLALIMIDKYCERREAKEDAEDDPINKFPDCYPELAEQCFEIADCMITESKKQRK